MTDIATAEEIMTRALRAAMEELMAECTEDQIAFLHRIHDNSPWKGLHNAPLVELVNSYDLVTRTVVKNRAGR